MKSWDNVYYISAGTTACNRQRTKTKHLSSVARQISLSNFTLVCIQLNAC